MRREIAVRLTLIAAAVALGCSPTTSPLDLVGTYSLTTVAGLPLPYVLPADGSTRVAVLDDVLVLSSSATYSEVGHKSFTTGGSVFVTAVVDAGSFSRRGNDITMSSLLVGSWSGTIDRQTLTLVQQGLTLVYQK